MTTGRRPRFDDLADTLDEAEVARHRSGPIALTPAGEVADTDTEVDGWEQIRRFRAEVAEVRAEAAAARAEAAEAKECAARSERKVGKAQAAVYGGAGMIGIGTIAVLKLAFGAGAKSNAAEQRDRELVETRSAVSDLQLRVIPAIRVDVATNAATTAGLRSALESLSRLGAVRLVGPQPEPLPIPEPVP